MAVATCVEVGFAKLGKRMSTGENHDQPTDGEQTLGTELVLTRTAMDVCHREWIEHCYRGQAPDAPRQVFDEAIRVVRARTFGLEEATKETFDKAYAFLYAVKQCQRLADLAKAEIAFSCSERLAELNRRLEEMYGGEEDIS
jgi:hypothetical protein